jgi:hypothetical protein
MMLQIRAGESKFTQNHRKSVPSNALKRKFFIQQNVRRLNPQPSAKKIFSQLSELIRAYPSQREFKRTKREPI